jgi:hypothetical protein
LAIFALRAGRQQKPHPNLSTRSAILDVICHILTNSGQLEMLLLDKRIFGLFGKLPILGRLVPQIIIPIHAAPSPFIFGSNLVSQKSFGCNRLKVLSGARALLVSHWAVDSNAAMRLTTSTFDIMKIAHSALFRLLAEFERSIIAERVRAGLAGASAEGKRLGRR